MIRGVLVIVILHPEFGEDEAKEFGLGHGIEAPVRMSGGENFIHFAGPAFFGNIEDFVCALEDTFFGFGGGYEIKLS